MIRLDPTELEHAARTMPKAELHIHIEGSLETKMMFALSAKNNISLAYPNVDALRGTYRFDNLQSFLDLYYAGTTFLHEQSDFSTMPDAYLDRAASEGVHHCETSFDTPTHVAHGLSPDDLILSLHVCEEKAFEALEYARPYLEKIVVVGFAASTHSEDLSYFGGYAADNCTLTARAHGLSAANQVTLGSNSFESGFLDSIQKQALLDSSEELSDPLLSRS